MSTSNNFHSIRFVDASRLNELESSAVTGFKIWGRKWIANFPSDMTISISTVTSIIENDCFHCLTTNGVFFYHFDIKANGILLLRLLGLDIGSRIILSDVLQETVSDAIHELVLMVLKQLPSTNLSSIDVFHRKECNIYDLSGLYCIRIGELVIWLPPQFLCLNPKAHSLAKVTSIQSILPLLQINAQVLLPQVSMDVSELVDLKVGSVIKTDYRLLHGAELYCDEKRLGCVDLSQHETTQLIKISG